MTIHLKSCWSPCFWHGNVKDGAYAIGGYTITMSICIITYIAYLLAGGDTSMLWLPFFETDLKSGTLQGSGGFTIFFLLVLMVLSVLMLLGVRNDIRGIIMPWIYAMYVVILFQAMFGLWLLFGYYIYLELVFSALCDFTWMGFNYYCVLVVKSQLRNLKKQQAPEIADIYDLA